MQERGHSDMAVREFESPAEECLTILAEECAELIQEIMKMKRRNVFYSNQFNDEASDVLLMLQIARDMELLDEPSIQKRFEVKRKKLKKWSRLL